MQEPLGSMSGLLRREGHGVEIALLYAEWPRKGRTERGEVMLILPVEIAKIPSPCLREAAEPMSVSSKCYYAIRAIYALAEADLPTPMKIAEIAEKEHIPIRFLEVILSQLKGGGFVQSRRGV